MDQQTDARIRGTLAHIVRLLVNEMYTELESLSNGVRLKAEHIQTGISEYGQVLVFPPEDAFDSIDIVPILGTDPAEYSIRFPLHTAKEGRSDLELQATLIDDSRGGGLMRVEIDDILVP